MPVFFLLLHFSHEETEFFTYLQLKLITAEFSPFGQNWGGNNNGQHCSVCVPRLGHPRRRDC